MDEINWFGKLPTQPRAKIIKQRVRISPEERHKMLQYDQAYFDSQSPYGYGGYFYDGRFEPIVRKMISYYKLTVDSYILDIGCAKGYILFEFFKLGFRNIFGIDISRYAIENVPKEIRKNCFVSSAIDLSRWDDNQFDFIITKDVLHNLIDEESDTAIKEIVRIGREKAFIQINSYDSDRKLECLKAWVITIKTIRSKKEWLEKFKALNYTGDYFFLCHDYEIA